MNTYTLFWRNGERELVQGNSPAEAMNQAGYGRGALGALDFYLYGDNHGYRWNASQRYWQPVAGQERTEATDLETAERERSAAICLAQDKALQACRMLYSAVQKCMETGGSLRWEDVGHAYAIAEETLGLLGELPIPPAVATAGEPR